MEALSEKEIAKKFGVPLVAVCYLMVNNKGFKEKTLFSWVVDKIGGSKEHSILLTKETTQIPKDKFEIIPAPQIHEISPLLPYEFDYKGEGKFYYLTLEYIVDKAVLCYKGKEDSIFRKDGHLAQQYANMWLRVQGLREYGFINF